PRTFFGGSRASVRTTKARGIVQAETGRQPLALLTTSLRLTRPTSAPNRSLMRYRIRVFDILLRAPRQANYQEVSTTSWLSLKPSTGSALSSSGGKYAESRSRMPSSARGDMIGLKLRVPLIRD